MIERTGNLFDTDLVNIAHGVNVYGMMGAGIAKEFKRRFPKNFDHYHNVCMLGNLKPGEVIVSAEDDNLIHNVASQDRPGPHARYVWLASGMLASAEEIADFAPEHRSIAIPEIGCGIGGLKWNGVKSLLMEIEDITGVEFEVWHYDG